MSITIEHTVMPMEERSKLLRQALQACKRHDIDEAQRILKIVPISPVAALTYKLLHGDDYLEKNGYNTCELD